MSFYGNSFYELTNAISTIIIKNLNNKDTEYVEVATGLDNSLTLDTGNKWITLTGAPQMVCTIAHAAPVADQSDSSFVAMTGEQMQLEPGGILTVSGLSYDEMGHITGTNETTYILPLSDTEKDIQDLADKVEKLEAADIVINGELSTLNGKIDATDGEVDSIQITTQDLNNLVGNRYAFTIDDNQSITTALGSYEDFKTTGYVTFSEGFQGLKEEVKSQNSIIADSSLATKVAIQNLCKALEQYDITINADSLWETTS